MSLTRLWLWCIQNHAKWQTEPGPNPIIVLCIWLWTKFDCDKTGQRWVRFRDRPDTVCGQAHEIVLQGLQRPYGWPKPNSVAGDGHGRARAGEALEQSRSLLTKKGAASPVSWVALRRWVGRCQVTGVPNIWKTKSASQTLSICISILSKWQNQTHQGETI